MVLIKPQSCKQCVGVTGIFRIIIIIILYIQLCTMYYSIIIIIMGIKPVKHAIYSIRNRWLLSILKLHGDANTGDIINYAIL